MITKTKTTQELQVFSIMSILNSQTNFNLIVKRLMRTLNVNRQKAIRFYVKERIIKFT